MELAVVLGLVRSVAALTLTAGLCVAGAVGTATAARADNVTASYDSLRTGWDPNESGLAPSNVSASDFGQLYSTQLDGQIYAQPIVARSTLLTATENDKVYGLNPVTGAINWSRDVGPYWPASAIGCGDLTPNIGVTSTPTYDSSTGTAYFMAKVNDGPDTDHPHWYLHAVDITTGAERSGFPTAISGAPSNDPSHPFDAKTAMQRPGLLLLGGVVYAGFASHCDFGPYVGYVAGVNASTGRQTTLWSTEAGSSSSEAGIWQSGGGLVSDGAGRIILTTGNGVSPPPGPGTSPPSTLAESVVRLGVNSDGSLSARDFFSPVNNTNLDTDDADLGSGGPLAIPDGYGTSAHPHLLVQVGKDGRVFLLDRDNLGGVGQGAGGTDSTLQTAGPYNGVWGHPAFWGGDGGYVYTIGNGGYLRAFKTGVSGSGLPSLTATAASTSTWGYTSGSPVVTSSGTTSGSALVWAVYSSGSNGSGGQLRAYDALPNGSALNLRYSAPIGTAAKFTIPATDGGRVFLGTRDGKLFGFGRPTTVALSGSPTDFGSVAVGSSATRTVTVTATRTVTVSGVSTAAPFTTSATGLPRTLTAGQTLAVAVTFTPTAAGSASGGLSFATDAGTLAFDLHGAGTQAGLASSPGSLSFGDVPTTGKVTLNVNISNTGTSAVTVTGATAPSTPFSAGSLPATGSSLAAGAAVSVPISFQPTTAGTFSSSLRITSSGGSVSVPIIGNGVAGAAHLSITPTTVDFGSVPVGTTTSSGFDIANTGNLVLTLTKAAPPAAPFGTATPVSEGQQLTPGQVIHQNLSFTPTRPGAVSGSYLITGNDGQGAQTVTVTGTGVRAPVGPRVPPPAAGGWQANGSATQSGGNSVLTTAAADEAGDLVYPFPVRGAGLHASFTARISGGTGADGLSFALLDASRATSTSLGGTGGALGYGGLTGVAITLDTFQNAGDPSANFVGIATGATGAGNDSLTYVASAAAPRSLRAGTHTVDITTTASSVTVSLDGGPALSANVAVPPTVLLAFTAGTGGQTDVHSVRKVSITQAPAAGPITGIAGKCVDVRSGVDADATPVQLYTCNQSAAQTWTVASANTLQALGKCLSLAGDATADATPVQLDSCNGAAADTEATVGERVAASCGGESFTPDTDVAMADGSTKPLDEVKVGDKVQATDPKTGKTSSQTVTQVWVNHDTDLMNVTISAGGKTSTIQATQHHLFWDATRKAWVEADQLVAGDQLRTDDGSLATVAGTIVVSGAADMWDLTVANDHDFYVVTATADVLVHNCPTVKGMPEPDPPLSQTTPGTVQRVSAPGAEGPDENPIPRGPGTRISYALMKLLQLINRAN